MKNFLFIITFLCSIFSSAQITEGFESGLPTSYSAVTSYTLGSGTWTGQANGVINTNTGVQSGSLALQLRSQTGSNIVSPNITSGVGVVSFYGSASTTSGAVQVNYSIDGGTNWIAAPGSPFSLTTGSPVLFSSTINNSSPNILVQFYRTASTVYIDDVNITTLGSTPTITSSTTSLSGFTYINGNGPSASQSYTVSGSNLTANLVLTAPINYEISLTAGSGYAGTLSFTPSSGTVTSKTIYVRLKAGLAIGSYNSQIISMTSTGATTRTVTCNGTVTGSIISDIITAGGESATVSSVINNATINTSTDGVQVWQFTIRDGGLANADLDALATIVNSLTITQGAGNTVNDWGDAIQAVALFNGTTKIADGVVSTNQIVFTGAPLVSVPDNGNVTLSVRLSIQTNPNNSGLNLDGDDFRFSITNVNATASSSGSQFSSSFPVATSVDNLNILSVVATQLVYTQQPVLTGVNIAMANVIVNATDVNGNLDLGFSSTVSITSTGSLVVSPISVTASSGVATFSTIVHNVVGTGYTLNASSTGLTSITSTLFDIKDITVLELGDLAIVAVNTNSSTGEEFAFVCFKDLLPDTEIFITDNGYERTTAGLWGDTEGVIKITRTGTTLPKGTIINIIGTNPSGINSGSDFVIRTCGVIDTNWIKDEITSGSFDLNKDDQIWFIQGGTFIDPAGSHNATFTGTVLYGWTDIAWKTAPNYASTSGSTIFPGLNCFNTDVNNSFSGASFVKFNDPVNPDFSTTTNSKLDWIALIDNPANWDSYATDAAYSLGGYDYKLNTTCAPMTIAATGYVNGKWTGKQNANWFNCGNWDTLKVPDETVDVLVPDTSYNNAAIVDATAPFASLYGNIARAKNLIITGEKVEVTSSASNILEVHGSLSISGTGVLDMSDSNSGTPDGTLHLYGNWSNSINQAAFDQGNSTVYFDGIVPQIIASSDAIGTEVFYNVVLNNSFDTAISNNLIAQGDLTVNSAKTLTVNVGNYAQVNNKLQLNGSMIIENNGQLVQVNETNTNAGTYTGTNFQVKRIAQARNLDYIYWSSPVVGFAVSNLPNSHRYEWSPTAINANSTQGNWLAASGNMSAAMGYIARASNGSTTAVALPIVFQGGAPNNGSLSIGISRGNTTGTDDTWNLVGNPYPSAMSAFSFLSDNPNIEGSVRLWTHGSLPSNTNASPFYQNFGYNYSESDYLVSNGTGSTTPGLFDGNIASGQGFFVRMLEDGETDLNPPANTITAGSSSIIFKNSHRKIATGLVYDNSSFYRNATNNSTSSEKSRIWLDLIAPNNEQSRTLIGYVPGATLVKDRMFDALIEVDAFKLYTLINTQKQTIQGRPVPFDSNDKVPMGIFVETAGNYTIAIATVDGLFTDGTQNIYLEDKLLNVIHDLRLAPYVFSSAVGEFNERFVLRYSNSVLSNQEFESTIGLIIYTNDFIHLKADELIKSVVVFDLLGRKIYEKNNITQTEVVLDKLMAKKEVLIIKTIFENSQIITKKIIF